MNNVSLEIKLKSGIYRVYSDKPDFPFLTVKQIHSNIIASESELGKDIISADGIIGTSLTPQCVLTADCLPIIITGKYGHAIIHAGWMGVRDLIVLDDKIKKLIPYQAYIGPHICTNCYEVQADFKLNFPKSNSFIEKDNKIYFNLFKEIADQLNSAYPEIEILHSSQCTYENSQFHSFRKNKTTKRNYNIFHPTLENNS